MEEEFGKDFVNGKILDWRKLSVEELKKLKEQLLSDEKKILKELDEELEIKNN